MSVLIFNRSKDSIICFYICTSTDFYPLKIRINIFMAMPVHFSMAQNLLNENLDRFDV